MNVISEALRHSIELLPRVRQLVTIMRSGTAMKSDAALAGLAVVAELRQRLQRVEDALTEFAPAEGRAVHAEVAVRPRTSTRLGRRRLARSSTRASEAPEPYEAGCADGERVYMAAGSHLHITQRHGVKSSTILEALLAKLVRQAEIAVTVSPDVDSDIEGDQGVSAVARLGPVVDDNRALVVVDGVEEATVETFLGAVDDDAAWERVTLVWVDRRRRDEGTAVTTEAALGHVAILPDAGETFVLGGLNGPGLEVLPV